jgi:hypothetical protein
MKLIEVIFENLIKGSPAFLQAVNNIKDQGGVLLGTGDYGNVYQVGGRVVKVTTDETELEHAEILKNKTTEHFVRIFDVEVIKNSLGIITMENLDQLSPDDEISEEFIEDLQQEAENLGVDPDELDIWVRGENIKRDNFMKDPSTGRIKMVDV